MTFHTNYRRPLPAEPGCYLHSLNTGEWVRVSEAHLLQFLARIAPRQQGTIYAAWLVIEHPHHRSPG